VLIDETCVVAELVQIICERIGIANPEEYSLQQDVSPAAQLLDARDKLARKKNNEKEKIRLEMQQITDDGTRRLRYS
jgi:hypothetical protein